MSNPLKEVHFAALVGIPGVASGTIQAARFASRTAGMRLLKEGHAITAASDNGAVNVYRNDSGKFHCELMRFRITRERAEFKHLAAVDAWLREWLPTID